MAQSMDPLLRDPLFVAALIISFIQLLYVGIVFLPLLFHKKEEASELSVSPLSVIVMARNEKENLKELIPEIMNQAYPEFELIVVDDHSSDGTYEMLHDLKKSYKQLEIVLLDEQVNMRAGKKLGLTLAIKRAKHEQLIFTDADCRPASDQWLKLIGNQYAKNEATKVVLGYSPLIGGHPLIQLFCAFEGFWTGLQYLGFAKAGRPYMGVGRNLSYSKAAFFANKGYASNNHIPYGDDDLLIQEIGKKSNTVIVIQPEAHVLSVAPDSPLNWLKQKHRHLSAGLYYRFIDKFLLGTFSLTHIVSLAGLFILPFLPGLLHPAFLMIAGLELVIWLIVMALHLRFKMNAVWFIFPLLDAIYHLIIYPFFAIYLAIKGKRKGW